MGRLRSIAIFGSSSGRNAGDAALLSGIMDGIDKISGRRMLYEIPTYRPEFVYASYENRVRPISMVPWAGSVGMFGIPSLLCALRADLSIIYDAMLFDRNLYNPLTNYMPAVRTLFPLAKKRGHILGMYNAGTGPVHTPRGREMLRQIGDLVDFITVRDTDSLQLLRDIGVQNPNAIITADAAFNVAPSPRGRVDEILKTLGMADEREILAINVNSYLNSWTGSGQQTLTKEQFVRIYAAALDTIVRELKVPLLFVCTQHHDVEITKAVMGALREPTKRALLSNTTYSHYDIRGVFERVSLLFAMRLHANILCLAGHTPAVALAFQKKVSSIYGMLHLSENVMSFENFSEESLATHVLKGWERRGQIRAKLDETIPRVQDASLNGARVVARIDEGYSPADAIAAVRESAPQKVAHGA